MTTIAYRDGVLASDGRATRGETIVASNSRKIYAMPDGSVVGFSGSPSEVQALLRWMTAVAAGEQAGEQPKIEESTMIIVAPDGSVKLLESHGSFEVDEKFVAIGSGAEGALAAMHAGATAIQAVEAACEVDPYSGGTIFSIALEAVVEALKAKEAKKAVREPRKTTLKRPKPVEEQQ